MKGFIETINRIKEICVACECCKNCPFREKVLQNSVTDSWCYFDLEPAHEWDANEILDRIAKWKGGAAHD